MTKPLTRDEIDELLEKETLGDCGGYGEEDGAQIPREAEA